MTLISQNLIQVMSNQKLIELDRKIGHKSVMFIRKFLVDRDDLVHLLYQAIHDM